MENATKALLIAAAVLVAIVIIAGGIAILRSASSSSSQAEDTGKVISMATDGAIKKLQKGIVTKEEFNDFINDIKNKYKSTSELVNTILYSQNTKIRNQIELIEYAYDGNTTGFSNEEKVKEANKKVNDKQKFGEYWENVALPDLLGRNKLIRITDPLNKSDIKSVLTNVYNEHTGSSWTPETLPTSVSSGIRTYWFFVYDSDGYIYKACGIYRINY